MPVDTSIYANLRPVDPLGAVSGGIGLANQFTNNQLLQTELQRQRLGLGAQVGVGNAYSGAVDANGNFDAPGYVAATAANGARYLGPANVSAAQGAAQATTQATGAKVALAQGQAAWAANNLLPLFNDPAHQPSLADVSGAITHGIGTGQLDPDIGSGLLLEANDAARSAIGLKGWAQNTYAGRVLGGGQSEPGQAIVTTQGTVAPTKGQAVKNAQGGPAQLGQNVTPPVSTLENIKAANDQYNTDSANGATALATARNLQSAIPLLEKLPTTAAGPVSEQWAKAKNLFAELGWIPAETATGDGGAATRTELKKYLSRAIGSTPGANRSDSAQDLAEISSPNLQDSVAAALHLARSVIGYNLMDAAMPMAYKKAPGQTTVGSDYLTSHRTNFQKNMDPDAFTFAGAGLPPDEQAKMIADKQAQDKKSPGVAAKFKRSVDMYDQIFGAQ